MPIQAWKIRGAAGNIDVAVSQLEGMFKGICKDTPERREYILQILRHAFSNLHEEASLVENFQTPTLKEWDKQGNTVFTGSVPYTYPPAEPVITTQAIEAIEKMVK